MIVQKSMSPEWLSNTYLVADSVGGHAVLIDTGGPTRPVLEAVERLGLSVTHALCTHHHIDHVAHNGLFRERLGARICAHRKEAHLVRDLDVELDDGEEIASGSLRILALHIPGHTLGQLAFVVNDERVFTGDTLFRGSVGGTRAPGHTTFAEIRRSIMEVLMRLPASMVVHPGHAESSTIAQEWASNPFIRVWRGLDRPDSGRCSVRGQPATLRLRATDYDGGTKCWVRFDDGGADDIVPGSWVRELSR